MSDQPQPRFILTMFAQPGDATKAAVQIVVNEPNVTAGEIMRGLLDVARSLANDPSGVLPTSTQVLAQQHANNTLRDYPARALHGPSAAYLCSACMDLFGHMLEGGKGSLTILPPGTPLIACTYHLDESHAPMTFAKASQIADPDESPN